MTVEGGGGEKKVEGKTVLVGIRLDGNGRDLLNWALAKVAGAGDNVVAVHVCRKLDTCSNEKPELSLEKSLNDFLAVYEVFCILKNVRLVGQICHEKSIRRVLVCEAKNHAAKALVVGLRHHYALGCPVSLAKYCAKVLPLTTAVLAVHNGKIIFQRDARNETIDRKGSRRSSLRTLFHSNSNIVHKEAPGVKSSEVSDVIKESSDGIKDYENDLKMVREKSSLINLIEDEAGRLSSCTVNTMTEIDPSVLADEDRDQFFQEQIEENSSSSITLLIRKLPESRPGWPLLRRAVSANVESLRDTKAEKLSVVQWVMNLPDRSLPATPLSQIQLHSQSPFRKEILESYEIGSRNFNDLEAVLASRSSNCKWFTYHELQTYTSYFASENLIGKGGSGRVYKGLLQDGQAIAVKLRRASKEVWKDFLLEVDILTSLQHKYVVPLIGICVKDNYLISIHTLFSKGSLEENIHGEGDKCALSWDVRYKIAVGVAEALIYLHNKHPRPVIHRDVKSSNVLLSDESKPMLSDFGLAIWGPTTSNYVTQCDVLGTFGYLAPEYLMYGKVSDKIDVYSYGVVLLELLSGRKPINTESPKGKESLVMWAMPILERDDMKNLLDPNLADDIDEKQIHRMTRAASLCLHRAAQLRPQMSQILELLQGEADEAEWLTSLTDSLKAEANQDEELYTDFGFKNINMPFGLLDEEEDTSLSDIEQNNRHFVEGYMQDRLSITSSYD